MNDRCEAREERLRTEAEDWPAAGPAAALARFRAPLKLPPNLGIPFAFGARVRVDGKHGIEGVVTGYAVYPHAREIKVSWFANGDSKSDWFADWRIAEIAE